MFRPRFDTLLAALLVCSWGPATAAPYPNTSHFGVPFSEDEAWHRQCMRVEGRSAPGLVANKGPALRCNASDLYYSKREQAVTSQAEWKQVRDCALAHEDDAVLMMLYANGFGVARDTDIAIHHACKLEFVAKAEMEGRIAHLAAPQRPGAVFDQCDDITSGIMGTMCAGIREGQAERSLKARLDRTLAALPAPARDAFRALRQAADRYADAGAAETDMQGTAAPSLAIKREGELRMQFEQLLSEVLDKRLPPASPQDLARADRELNTVYRSLMLPSEHERPDRIGDSTITRKDVREAERRWIAYRDAFVAFRVRLASGPSPDAIGAALTRQRLAELNRLRKYR